MPLCLETLPARYYEERKQINYFWLSGRPHCDCSDIMTREMLYLYVFTKSSDMGDIIFARIIAITLITN